MVDRPDPRCVPIEMEMLPLYREPAGSARRRREQRRQQQAERRHLSARRTVLSRLRDWMTASGAR